MGFPGHPRYPPVNMSDILARIKRAVMAGNIEFTDKASIEIERDQLTEQDVKESILAAPRIFKTLRSTSLHRSGRREYLHVIISSNFSGTTIYSKGKLVERKGADRYYVLVSAKRSS
jgi:hypothetical protein